MFAILGSGFGLYGYLPALIGACAQTILLPRRYFGRLAERDELAHFMPDIVWVNDEETLLDNATGAVIALRPTDQHSSIARCLELPGIERLLLEKPLAASPNCAAAILEDLLRSAKLFRIAYTFRYTAWGRHLLQIRAMDNTLAPLLIQWHFLAHHYHHDLHNWKRYNSSGGGAIRFYGIHLIALLAELGYDAVYDSHTSGASPDEVERWYATFVGKGLPDCTVEVDTHSNCPMFKVGQGFRVLADLTDPFHGVATKDGIDVRVGVLVPLCESLWQESATEYVWYESSIKLWALVEGNTKFNATY